MLFITGVRDEGFEIGGAEVVADGLNAAGLIEMIANVKCFHIATGADECSEVPTCGTAPGTEACGVDLIRRGVCSQPADGSFAVFDLRGENGMAAEAVINAGDGVTAFEPTLSEW